jgi:rod shape-determining protein MreD
MVPFILLLTVVINQIYAPFSGMPLGLEPDIALIVAVFSGFVYPPVAAAALGFGAGILQDTLSGGLIGVGAFSKGLTGLLWARLWRQVFGDGPLLQLPLLAGLTLVDGVAFFSAAALFSTHVSSWEVLLPLLGRQLLSNLLLGPLLSMLFAALYRKLGRTKRSGWSRHAPATTYQPK